jgi:uncharacterized membrane protein
MAAMTNLLPFAQQRMNDFADGPGRYMGAGHGGDGGPDGWWVFALLAVLLLAALLGVVTWMARRLAASTAPAAATAAAPGAASAAALETLDGRLASGEMSVEDYRARREALGASAAGGPAAPPADPEAPTQVQGS